METVTIGSSGHHPHQSSNFGKVGLGTGTLASLGKAATLPTVTKILDTMESNHLGLLDTADSYGSGDCEILLSKAIRGRRDKFRIVTKAGYRYSNLKGPFRPINQFLKKIFQKTGPRQIFTAEYLDQCLGESLRRLRTDHVDVFLLHDPSAEVVASGSIQEFLREAKSTGKALSIGVSSCDPEVLTRAIECGYCEVIQTPANPMCARELSSIWRACVNQGIHMIANHVYEPNCIQASAAGHRELMQTISAVLPREATILCGTRNPSHLIQSLGWANESMPEDAAWNRIDKIRAATTGQS